MARKLDVCGERWKIGQEIKVQLGSLPINADSLPAQVFLQSNVGNLQSVFSTSGLLNLKAQSNWQWYRAKIHFKTHKRERIHLVKIGEAYGHLVKSHQKLNNAEPAQRSQAFYPGFFHPDALNASFTLRKFSATVFEIQYFPDADFDNSLDVTTTSGSDSKPVVPGYFDKTHLVCLAGPNHLFDLESQKYYDWMPIPAFKLNDQAPSAATVAPPPLSEDPFSLLRQCKLNRKVLLAPAAGVASKSAEQTSLQDKVQLKPPLPFFSPNLGHGAAPELECSSSTPPSSNLQRKAFLPSVQPKHSLEKTIESSHVSDSKSVFKGSCSSSRSSSSISTQAPRESFKITASQISEPLVESSLSTGLANSNLMSDDSLKQDLARFQERWEALRPLSELPCDSFFEKAGQAWHGKGTQSNCPSDGVSMVVRSIQLRRDLKQLGDKVLAQEEKMTRMEECTERNLLRERTKNLALEKRILVMEQALSVWPEKLQQLEDKYLEHIQTLEARVNANILDAVNDAKLDIEFETRKRTRYDSIRGCTDDGIDEYVHDIAVDDSTLDLSGNTQQSSQSTVDPRTQASSQSTYDTDRSIF